MRIKRKSVRNRQVFIPPWTLLTFSHTRAVASNWLITIARGAVSSIVFIAEWNLIKLTFRQLRTFLAFSPKNGKNACGVIGSWRSQRLESDVFTCAITQWRSVAVIIVHIYKVDHIFRGLDSSLTSNVYYVASWHFAKIVWVGDERKFIWNNHWEVHDEKFCDGSK